MLYGGDGFFMLFVNALRQQENADDLLNTPMALMPGGKHLRVYQGNQARLGSTNAIACDAECRDHFKGAVHVLRRTSFKIDMFNVYFEKSEKTVLATSISCG